MNLLDFDIDLNFNDGEKFSFNLELGDTFFSLKDNSLLSSGDLLSQVSIIRHEDTLDLQVDIKGHVNSSCDRCLNDIRLLVDTKFTHFLKFTSNEELWGDEVHIPADSSSYSLYDLLYENICLNVSPRHLCENSDKGVECEVLSFKQNTKENDPRWDQLKKLID